MTFIGRIPGMVPVCVGGVCGYSNLV